MSKYFSQYKQDEFVDKVIFNKKSVGFFVDIGAHDGISLSNSYFFEQNRNYLGLCIEPNPKVFLRLQENRKCDLLNVCISNSKEAVAFLSLEGNAEMLSGILDTYNPKHLEWINKEIACGSSTKSEILVNSTLLQDIPTLKGITIDYISIDTEGSEKEILKSIDFSKLKAICLTIENNYDDDEIDLVMIKNNYKKIVRLGQDDVYILCDYLSFKIKFRKWLFVYKNKAYYYFNKFLKTYIK